MDVSEAIRKRFSVRAYKDKPVEEEKLMHVLEAARNAPSASNVQEWHFVVVRDRQTRQKLIDVAAGQEFVGQAPIVIAACASNTDHVMRCGQLAYPIDLAIAIDHMTLQATELGLGTCWIVSFHEDRARDLLGIPKDIRIVQLVTLGYPAADPPAAKPRKSLDEIIHYDKW